MGRRASVRYWESRGVWRDAQGQTILDDKGKPRTGGYCCTYCGRQHILAVGPDDYPHGPTYNAAVKAFARLTVYGNSDSAKDENPIRVVLERYLQDIAGRGTPNTLQTRQKHLGSFCDFADPEGTVPVHRLTPSLVREWIAQKKLPYVNPRNGVVTTWSRITVRGALMSLLAALNWAVKEGLITQNPVKGIDVPGPTSRGRRALLGKTPQERAENHRRILADSRNDFRDLLICLEATGARPSELMHATAADYHADKQAIIYYPDENRHAGEYRHKTAGHGRTRKIIFTGEAVAVVERLVKKHPTGPIFRTAMGRPWTGVALSQRFRRLQERLGMDWLTAYCYRHTFATAWLEKGLSVDLLGQLLGNSPQTIRLHYAHLLEDEGNLLRHLQAFRAATTSAEGTRSPSAPPAAADAAAAVEAAS